MRYLVLLLTALISSTAFAQQGTIRGKVLDDQTGEELIGVTVLIKGTLNGATTDLDGEFTIKVEPGTYDLQISYISYQTTTVEDVQSSANEVNYLSNIRLKESTLELQEVVVTAQVLRNTEQALHTVKKRSPVIMDGISTEKMQLTGDATAVEAAKRVTGVSVEGGKYIYIRGLGDRYSKTTLDNVDIPGLDPDRNTIQMDLFPSSLIENIMVSKNFTADLPADFTGGMLNIQTKDFPEERIFNVSIGTSYNPDMNLISDFLSYPKGNTDWLGYDDGSRRLPAGARHENFPSPANPSSSEQEINDFIKRFNPQLSTNRGSNFLNYNASISYGDQINIGRAPKLGYVFSLSYRNEHRYYNDVFYGEYQRLKGDEVYDLRYANIQTGQLGETTNMLGALAGIAFKTQFTKIRLTGMRLQSGESRAGAFNIDNNGEATGQSGYIAESDNLEYNQRSITNLLLNGTHISVKSGWEIDWRLSPTLSTLEDPDIRKTAFSFKNGKPTFNAGEGGNPTRIWRNLNELNAVAKLDITKKYKFNGKEAKFKIGATHSYKDRDYEILSYDLQFWGLQPDWANTDPNQILKEENIYPQGIIYYSSGNSTPNSNAYQSNATNSGAYISNEFNVFPKFKTILGIRAENFVLRHTGRDQTFANGDVKDGRNLEDEVVLESLDFFPSVNFIYNITEPQNLRLSYTKTIARPSFKEMSFAQILDPVTNRIFNGGLFPYPGDWEGNLSETRIDNLDMRWEYFLEGGQILSVSAFYKTFDKPIELVRIPEQQTSVEVQPRNVGNGLLYGAEFELVKNLDFISPSLRFFNISTNVTWVQSQIEMTNKEYNSRVDYRKTGETISNKRQMAGQSPYVINAGFTYSNFDNGIESGFFYNVKGPTLEIVGVGLYPDIYTQPFHSLNFTFNKKLGAKQNPTIDFKVSNILNDKIESYFEAYNTDVEIFSSINPGRTVSLGISHNF